MCWLVDKMIRGRRFFIFLISIAVYTASASAGIIAQPQDTELLSCSQASSSQNSSYSIHDDLFKAEFNLCYDKSLPDVPADLESGKDVPECQPLTDGTNSLSLCLSVLIGCGFFGSIKYIRTLNFGFIPDWYHDGGPNQIGHSLAINPDCICNITDDCFIQPLFIEDNSLLPKTYCIKQILSLWRDSQFTPDSIAYRGPPLS